MCHVYVLLSHCLIVSIHCTSVHMWNTIMWNIVCKEVNVNLAGSEDLEHERKAMCDEFFGVLVLLDAAKVFKQALDQRPSLLQKAGLQRLQPCVQSPRHTYAHDQHSSVTLCSSEIRATPSRSYFSLPTNVLWSISTNPCGDCLWWEMRQWRHAITKINE